MKYIVIVCLPNGSPSMAFGPFDSKLDARSYMIENWSDADAKILSIMEPK